VLGCKSRNAMCFLASGGGTCPQMAVLGLLISVSQAGFSLAARQARFSSVAGKRCVELPCSERFGLEAFWRFLSRAGSARFE